MENTGDKTSDLLKELVITNGDQVAMGEPPCVLWKSNHDNCVGCPYELGCGKLARIMIIMMSTLVYEPKDFEDFSRMHNHIQELQDMVLKARTVEELRQIPHM